MPLHLFLNYHIISNTIEIQGHIMQIHSVKIVEGDSLQSNWKRKMQIVSTDKGDFIDNMPGNNFVGKNDYAIKPSVGFDWNTLIGKEVHEVVIYHSHGFNWINNPQKNNNTGTIKTGLKILKVDRVKGRTLKSNWKSNMQKITTSEGVYIDTLDKCDWDDYVGETLSKNEY